MRRVAAVATGVLALALMLIAEPWGRLDCRPGECSMSSEGVGWAWEAIGLLVYLAIPAAILCFVLVAILRIRPADPGEAAVRAALGETGGAGVRRAARRGLLDGAIAAAGAFVVAGAVHLVLLDATGWPLGTDAQMWRTRLYEGLIVGATLAVAHVLAAWRPRRTPVERLREDVEAARPPRIGRRVAVFGILGAGAATVIVVLATRYDIAPDFHATNAAGIAIGIAWIGLVGLGLGAVLPWASGLAPRFVAVAAGLADGLGASRLAAVLAARASSPTKATGRTVLAVGGIVFAVVVLLTPGTGVRQSDAAIATVALSGDADATGFADALRAIDGVAAVLEGTELSTEDSWSTVVAVDPAALWGIDDEIAAALTAHPEAAVSGATNVNDVTTEGFTPSGIVPMRGGWASYVSADEVTGEGHRPYFLIYAEDGADRAAIDQAVSRVPTDASGVAVGTVAGEPGVPGLMGFAIATVVLTLVLAPVAAGAVKAGMREAATLVALGVETRVLRVALVIEGAVVAAVGVAAGAVAGIGTRMTITALEAARRSLTGVITDSFAGAALESVWWAGLVGCGVLVVAVFAGVTALAAAAERLETPADALRGGAAAR
ncbi:hypothetical protein [Demequina soli]|uniref:hypothetical protein n=1 Tax=Demequina soli TaxID=1638987 RepID=UPI000786332F|nr:hypothetical protein [Demequina soli]